MNIPKSFASNVLPTQWAPFTPCFPKRSSENCSQVWPRFLWSLCFVLGPSAHESLCVPFKNGVSVSPSPVELLCTSPTGLQCQMLRGLFLPVPDPQAWGLDVGLRTLTPVGESLWNSYFPVLGAYQLGGMGLLISCNRPSYLLIWPPLLSSGVGYLFESFWSIWLKIAQHLVVNFVIFRREIELQSFYSTIFPILYSCLLSED